MTSIDDSPFRRDNYDVVAVTDKRPRPEGFVQFAVVGHNGFTIQPNGTAGFKDLTVLFTTQLDGYDGGQAECDSWVAGFNARVGKTIPTICSSQGI